MESDRAVFVSPGGYTIFVTASASHPHPTVVLMCQTAAPLAVKLIKQQPLGLSIKATVAHRAEPLCDSAAALSSASAAVVFTLVNGSDDMLWQLVYFTSRAALLLFMSNERSEHTWSSFPTERNPHHK